MTSYRKHPMYESTTALHPKRVTVRRIFSHGPAADPSGGKTEASAKAPFVLPGPDSWEGVLLTSAPLSCWHLLYKSFLKCQHSFFDYFQNFSPLTVFSGRPYPVDSVRPAEIPAVFCTVCPAVRIPVSVLSGKMPILRKAFDKGGGNVTIEQHALCVNMESEAPRRRKG